MTAFIIAKAVSYAIRHQVILDAVSLALASGRLTLIIGPNGAGKSTLLKLLAGELTSSGGSIFYDAAEIRQLSAWQLAGMRAVMAQTTQVSFPFAAHEVARLGIDGIGRGLSRARRDRLVGEALAEAGVAHLAARRYQSLSGGEQQRVQFARALCQLAGGRDFNARQALFLDEPTSNLDMGQQLNLMDHVRELARSGTAVCMSVHDFNLATAYADHLIVLRSGQIAAQGRPDAVLTDELLAKVFGVHGGLRELPREGTPFFLPHRHAEMHAAAARRA